MKRITVVTALVLFFATPLLSQWWVGNTVNGWEYLDAGFNIDSSNTGMCIVFNEATGDSVTAIRISGIPELYSDGWTLRTIWKKNLETTLIYQYPASVYLGRKIVPFVPAEDLKNIGIALEISIQGGSEQNAFYEDVNFFEWCKLETRFFNNHRDFNRIKMFLSVRFNTSGYKTVEILLRNLNINDSLVIDSFNRSIPTGVRELPVHPEKFTLHQNYPNPFNPTTVIRYEVPEASVIKLSVYNLLGQEVATLVSGEQSAGTYEVDFNGTDLSSGMYTYVLQAGPNRLQRKMLLVK